MPDDLSASRIQGVHADAARGQKIQQAQMLAEYAIAQETAAEGFDAWGDQNAWNPLAVSRNFQPLDKRVHKMRTEDLKEAEKEEEEGALIERLGRVSEDFQRKNPELQAKSLLLLRSRINKRDTAEDILRKVRESYPDFALADEALDFLLETTEPALRSKIAEAKAELNRVFEREIKAGRNMGAQAREFSSKGLGSPTALRELYMNVTRNPRDANTLFLEFSSNYSYDKLKSVIDFLLHSLGSDMKSKGPSISPGELSRLFTETRNMQAILGVYRFFQARMRLISGGFDRQGLVMPKGINFELLAKTFMRFVQERYPSVEKALMLSQQLGIAKEVMAQVIIYIQFRDAMRQLAPKLFKDDRHRQDLLNCFIETLEELDEELEEEEEKEEKEK